MDRGYYLNAGIPPPLHFESSPAPTWQALSSAPELNCSPELSSDCFLNPSWDKSTDQFSNFESTLNSKVQSPSPSLAAANDNFGIRELIGKLGTICNSVDIPPQSNPFPAVTAAYIGGGNNSTITSRYSMPSNSPPKKENPPNSGHSIPVNPNIPDTMISKRAEKFFSSLGSHSFNGRTSQPGLNNTELLNRPSPMMMASVKFPRVSSTPSLKADGSPMCQENKNSTKTQVEMRSTIASNTKFSKIPGFLLSDRTEFAGPNEGPSVSEQNPSGEVGLRTPTDSISRKRKAVSRGKSSVNTTKVAEAEGEPNTKRPKSTEGNGNDNGSVKTEEERKRTINGVSEDHKEPKADDPKPPEPQKDYIHVRARRGQATDSHSLAERVRREKISERMKLLQDLVPGCNKVTGKALMLDEIINYVQSLQRQVEFLSMKLASVNPWLDFNVEGLSSKDVFHPNRSFPHPTTYPLDSSESSLFGQQTQGIPQVHTKGAVTQSSGGPIDTTGPNNGFQFDEFGQGGLPQFSTLCEDDLQSIVQMGFGQHEIEP